ncbi:hypothetical protein SK571_33720 [Lentzea sp. BCCO 10_0798]|uniref:Uncharacterized protein n=1 Tax=Lentzea kristufekii TaxID=3095430 RepID=A0ABU4U1G6_9PSEU|nr:hypothetical protein [Lentzea sp. BCCO 10_0798]MDX8054356.1 hypothetical protein [Lentzea sp. BCCO 10_0798]
MGVLKGKSGQLQPRRAGRWFEQVDPFCSAQHDQPHVRRHRLQHHVGDEGSFADVARDLSGVVGGVDDDREQCARSARLQSRGSGAHTREKGPAVVLRLCGPHRDQWIAQRMRCQLVRQVQEAFSVRMSRLAGAPVVTVAEAVEHKGQGAVRHALLDPCGENRLPHTSGRMHDHRPI